jgi:hypothetical protein
MNVILFILVLLPLTSLASVVGISTHPLNDDARVFSAEMTGFMSQRHEVGMGARYTQEMAPNRLLDISAGGAQESRALMLGTGMDFAILDEDIYQPRVSIKPYMQYQRFENFRQNLIGAAPTIRKGFSIQGFEFFPYLAIPSGLKLDNTTDQFVYYSSLTIGSSMPFPGFRNEKLLLSLEGNKDMGSSSDYIGCLVSWVWH